MNLMPKRTDSRAAQVAQVTERAPRTRGELQTAVYTELLDSIRKLDATSTKLIGQLRGGIHNDVLGVELAEFDDDGVITRQYGVPTGSVFVANHGTGNVVVSSGPQGPAAPGGGKGLGRVPAGSAQVINLASPNLTLYGTAGELVSLQVFTKPQPPTAGRATADTELPAAAALSDATSNPTTPMVGAAAMLWNGTNWQRWSSNLGLLALASAERTALVNGPDMSNFNCRGGHFVINVTDDGALTPSVTFTVEGKDPVSGAYYPILVSGAITTVGTTKLTVYPGAATVANLSVADVLPPVFRIRAAVADTDPITYSVGVSLIL